MGILLKKQQHTLIIGYVTKDIVKITNYLYIPLLFEFCFTMKVELEGVRCITDTALTIRGSRRRVTVPSEVVDILKLNNGDKLRWIVFNDGNIRIKKIKK